MPSCFGYLNWRCEVRAVDNFRVPESQSAPTAHPFGEKISQVGRVEGDPRFRLPAAMPRRGFFPAAVFFTLVLCLWQGNEATAAIAPPSRKKHKFGRTMKSN
jgi:hypothetical protein